MAVPQVNNEAAKPIPFETTGSQPAGPQAIPKQTGLFNWIHSLGSPPSSATAPLSSPSRSNSITAAANANAANGAAKRFSFSRPRKDSSSLTHDEALNISRAGWAATAGSSSANGIKEAIDSDTFATSGSFEILSPRRTPVAPESSSGGTSAAFKRRRSSSRYDQLGLMAAYSGGPQSF